MNGIEKISARILADAESEAAAIRAQAEEKAALIRADYDRRIESEQQRLTAEAQAEGAKQLERDQGAASCAQSFVYSAVGSERSCCSACRKAASTSACFVSSSCRRAAILAAP